METKKIDDLIAVNEFCIKHNIEISFVNLLQQNGLIEISTIESTRFVEKEQLPFLEKYIRLYYELDINVEGIDTITHLLYRLECQRNEIVRLKNKLRFFEVND